MTKALLAQMPIPYIHMSRFWPHNSRIVAFSRCLDIALDHISSNSCTHYEAWDSLKGTPLHEFVESTGLHFLRRFRQGKHPVRDRLLLSGMFRMTGIISRRQIGEHDVVRTG